MKELKGGWVYVGLYDCEHGAQVRGQHKTQWTLPAAETGQPSARGCTLSPFDRTYGLSEPRRDILCFPLAEFQSR